MRRHRSKRASWRKRRIKKMPFLLAMMLLLSVPVFPGMWVYGAGHNQVTKVGETQYYMSDGTRATSDHYAVSVTKKISQSTSGGAAVENQFKVDLTVETADTYEQVVTTKDAAVVLVLDLSASMAGQCADCGRVESSTVNDPYSGVPYGYDRAQAHRAAAAVGQRYCPVLLYGDVSSSGSTGIYKPKSGAGSSCAYCWKDYSKHELQHVFSSRLETAKTNVAEFLKQYAADTGGAKRYLSVVVFADRVDQPQSWINVSGMGEDDRKALVNRIFDSNVGNDTNTTGGMAAALGALNQVPAGMPVSQSSVILMTDGLPGRAAGTSDISYSGKFGTEYQAAKDYCEAAKGKVSAFDLDGAAFRSLASYGLQMRDKGASLYTVSFASGEPEYAVGRYPQPDYKYLADYLKVFADVGYDAHNAKLLGDAFSEIIQKMTELRPNTVGDILPGNFHVVDGSFRGDTNISGGGSAVEVSKNVVSWGLSGLAKSKNAAGRYVYQLSYEMVLNNMDSSVYTNGVVKYPVNKDAPTFTFAKYAEGSNTTEGPMYRVAFDIPEVEAYAVDLKFTKVNPKGDPIGKTGQEGAAFQLTVDGGETIWIREARNDTYGRVQFLSVPSGHNYKLVETKAPLGFETDSTPRSVSVSWGIMNDGLDSSSNPNISGKVLINKYDTAPKTFTVQKIWEDSTDIYKARTVQFTVLCMKPDGSVAYTTRGSISVDNQTAQEKTWSVSVPGVPTKDGETGAELHFSIEESPIDGYTLRTTSQSIDFSQGQAVLTMVNELKTRDITVSKIWIDPTPSAISAENLLLELPIEAPPDAAEEPTSGAVEGPASGGVENSVPEDANKPPAQSPEGTGAEAGTPAEKGPEADTDGSQEIVVDSGQVPGSAAEEGERIEAAAPGHKDEEKEPADKEQADKELADAEPEKAPSTEENQIAGGGPKAHAVPANMMQTAAAAPAHPNITVNLYNNSTNNVYKSVTMQAISGESTVTFTDLPVLDAKGQLIQYRVGEEAVPGYRLSNITGSMDGGYILENTSLACDVTDIPVHKHWYDNSNANGYRPDSVTIELQKNATSGTDEGWTRVTTLELSPQNMLNNNPDVWASTFQNLPTHNGGAPIYYRVREVQQESWKGKYQTSYSSDGLDINNMALETSVTVRKTWAKPADVTAPTVTFQLYRDGGKYKQGTLMAPATVYTFENLPRINERSSEYVYTVKELPVPGYDSAQVGDTPNFKNTIGKVFDVTVKGTVKWEMRLEKETVRPEKVTVRLYANGSPALNESGGFVDREVSAASKWSFEFKNALRYSLDGYNHVEYSVRELSKDGTPVPDSDTVQFIGADGEVHDFGAHYLPIQVSADGGTFTCHIRNHTGAEADNAYAARVNWIYNDYVDEKLIASVQISGDTENGGYHHEAQPFKYTINTSEYTRNNGKEYVFKNGSVGLNGENIDVRKMLRAGSTYDVDVNQADGVYTIDLYYAHNEVTNTGGGGGGDGGGGDGGDHKPDPKPEVPKVDPETPILPPEPTPKPEEPIPPTDPTKPTQPIPPGEEGKVEDAIKDAITNPDVIIRNKEDFEKRYPGVNLDDLPTPLYWGPDFAVVQLPDGEIIVIDPELVPAGAIPGGGTILPITGMAPYQTAEGMSVMSAVLIMTGLLMKWRKRSR